MNRSGSPTPFTLILREHALVHIDDDLVPFVCGWKFARNLARRWSFSLVIEIPLPPFYRMNVLVHLPCLILRVSVLAIFTLAAGQRTNTSFSSTYALYSRLESIVDTTAGHIKLVDRDEHRAAVEAGRRRKVSSSCTSCRRRQVRASDGRGRYFGGELVQEHSWHTASLYPCILHILVPLCNGCHCQVPCQGAVC